jgi:hypothetical protein
VGDQNRQGSRNQQAVKVVSKEQVRVKVVSRKEQHPEVPRKAEVEESEDNLPLYYYT